MLWTSKYLPIVPRANFEVFKNCEALQINLDGYLDCVEGVAGNTI